MANIFLQTNPGPHFDIVISLSGEDNPGEINHGFDNILLTNNVSVVQCMAKWLFTFKTDPFILVHRK